MVVAALAAGLVGVPGAWAAGLALTVSGAPAQLIAGDRMELTARVSNLTAAPATAVLLNFVPFAEDQFVDPPAITSIATGSCIPFGPSLNCEPLPANLAPLGQFGDAGLATVGVALVAPGVVRVDVGVQADPGLSAPGVSWSGTVEAKADLKLGLTTSAESVLVGAPVTVRGLATNTRAEGTAYATAVRFSIPAGVEVMTRPPDCTGTALSLTCPVGDIGPLATAERDLTLRSATEGSFTVLGSVAWARPDTTPVDTQGQVTVSVQLPPEPEGPPPPPKPKPKPKPTTARAATLAQGLPAAGRCVRTRRLTIALRSRGAWDPVRAVIRVTGRKRALIVKGSRALELITVPLPRSGRVTLRLQVAYDNGRRYKATRSFRRC